MEPGKIANPDMEMTQVCTCPKKDGLRHYVICSPLTPKTAAIPVPKLNHEVVDDQYHKPFFGTLPDTPFCHTCICHA
jgi:hypothetical protein